MSYPRRSTGGKRIRMDDSFGSGKFFSQNDNFVMKFAIISWTNVLAILTLILGQQGYGEGYDQSNDGGEEAFDPMAFYRQQQQEMLLQATQHVQVEWKEP